MHGNSRYISAFAEFADPIPAPENVPSKVKAVARLPTLWKGSPDRPKFLPFVVESPAGYRLDSPQALEELLRSASVEARDQTVPNGPQLRDIPTSRFRVALPVPSHAMHSELSEPTDPDCEPEQGLRAGSDGQRLTVVAIIDDGIPFAHRNFRDADGAHTRVEFCWLQSADVQQGQTSVLFGREYTRADINRAIACFGDDEDHLYDAVGATCAAGDFGSLLGHHTTHGSHVMNLATGYDAAHGEDPPEHVRIIAVQLPNSVTMDTSGFGKDMYLLSAFHYIFHRVDVIKTMYGVPDPRLVINFSYGSTGGRHDGGDEVEAAIDELIQMRRRCAPTALVLAAGNTFLDRLHLEVHDYDFDHDDVVVLPWRIQPNGRTPAYLELWFYQDAGSPDPFAFSVELRNPSGMIACLRDDPSNQCQTSLPVGVHHSARLFGDPIRVLSVLNPAGQVIGQISADFDRADMTPATSDDGAEGRHRKTGRRRVLVAMAPTEPHDDCLPGADSGRWTVTIRRTTTARLGDHPIHCWIQRSTDFESFRSGSRQSYFDLDTYEEARFTPQGDLAETDTVTSPVKRFGSLNGLATGRMSLVVGGYRLGAGLGSSLACAQPARYSAAGTLRPDWIEKIVDCSAMSDRSRALPGTISAGVRSGSRSVVQGTSAAAPIVARQLVETFVTADDHAVKCAEATNYLSLLCGYVPESREQAGRPDEDGSCSRRADPELIKARLGAVLVPPHRQPGLELRPCDHDTSARPPGPEHPHD
ncbi:S8 family serine peptidase [Bradyrhizobium oligotrophicum]